MPPEAASAAGRQVTVSLTDTPAHARAEPSSATTPETIPEPDARVTAVPHRSPPPERRAAAAAPRIAVIVDDMGVDARRSARVVRLDAALTLSYLPYAAHVRTQAQAARAAGHEILVHLPMEPLDPDADAGPNALRVGLAPAENLRRLEWALGRFDGYVGINNHMGSRFTASRDALRPVLGEVERRGLFFVDSVTVADSAGPQLARAMGLRFAQRDVFLDHRDDAAEIRRRLRLLEDIARETGSAIGIGHPRDATIHALKKWIPAVRKRGFVLVPVSRLVHEEPLISAPRLGHGRADGPA